MTWLKVGCGVARFIWAGILGGAAIVCSVGCVVPQRVAPAWTIGGQVDFGGARVQATLADVAARATVSVIDATSGNTVVTTVTTEQGGFSLTFPRTFVPGTAVYILEAVKGLNQNRAGRDAARVRTFIQWASGGYRSMNSSLLNNPITISRTTTALAVIQSLRQLPPDPLIGALDLGVADTSVSPPTPDTFRPGSSGITQQQFHDVTAFVGDALSADLDPLQAVSLTGAGAFVLQSRAPAVTDVLPALARVGDTVTLTGTQFDPMLSGNRVFFAGASGVIPTSATPTSLVVVVPPGAVTGDLQVSTMYGLSATRSFAIAVPFSGTFTGS